MDCNDDTKSPYLLTICLSTVVDCEHMCHILLLPCKDTQLILLWYLCICTHLDRPRPWHASVWMNQSKVISNEDTCCGCVSFVLNDAPHNTNLSYGYRVEVKYTQYFYILNERIRTIRSQDCCKFFILYFVVSMLSWYNMLWTSMFSRT